MRRYNLARSHVWCKKLMFCAHKKIGIYIMHWNCFIDLYFIAYTFKILNMNIDYYTTSTGTVIKFPL